MVPIHPIRLTCSQPVKRVGFTRAEIITTIFVLFVMVGIAIPVILQRRGISQRQFCESRQMVVAKGLFMQSVDATRFPGFRETQVSLPGKENPATSWVFPVLPYIHPLGSELADQLKEATARELVAGENRDLFGDGPYRLTFESFGSGGERAGETIPDYIVELVCPESDKGPTDSTPQPLSFVANCGMPDVDSKLGPLDHLSNGVFFDRVKGNQLMTIDFLSEHDGLENTFMISENLNAGQTFDTDENQIGFVWIASEVDGVPERDGERLLGINELVDGADPWRQARPSSHHVGGVNVAFADGSTMFLNERIDYIAYVQFMTADGYSVKLAGTNDNAEEPYRLVK